MKSDASQGRRDVGAALLLAIVVVTGISVALAAALGFAATSVKSSAESYRPARQALYRADAAVKLAAEYYRQNADGKLVADCADGTTTLQIDAETTVEVCDSSNDGTSFDSDLPGPDFGLMTTSSTLGIELRTGRIRLAGGAYSAATVTGPNGSTGTNMLSVERGGLHAVGACGGNIEVAAGHARECGAGAVSVPVYTTGLTEAPAPGTATSCSLSPGYWSAEAFDDAIDGCDAVHLEPGLHYLHDVDWTISSTVIGGTLSAGIDLGDVDPDTDLPGACDVAAAGTMIVLGGTSSITLNGLGAVEVCGMTTTQGGQQIRIPLIGSDATIGGGGSSDVTLSGGTSASVTGIARNGSKSAVVSLSSTTDLTNASALALSYASGSKTGNVTGSVTARTSGASTDCASGVLDLTGGAPADIDLSACLASLDLPLSLTFRFSSSSANGSGSVSGIAVVATLGAAGDAVLPLDGGDTDPVLSTTATNKHVILHGVTHLPTRPIDLDVPNDAEVGATRALIVESITINAGGGSAGDERPPIVGSDLLQPGDGELTFDAYVGGELWLTTRGQYTANAGPLSLAIDRWIVRR